jgi:hypothetical protein
MVSVMDPYGSIFGFLDRSRYQVAPQFTRKAERTPLNVHPKVC